MDFRLGKCSRLIPYILMIAVFAAVAPAVRASDKAQDHLSKGMVLAENGDLNGAIVEYRKALKINPDFAAAHNNLGLALVKLKDVDGAIAEFREAMRVVTAGDAVGEAIVHFNLGIAYRAKGDTATAISEYNKAIELNPELIQARSNLGALLEEQGEPGRSDRAVSRSAEN